MLIYFEIPALFYLNLAALINVQVNLKERQPKKT